jgi:GntR family transcriptional regulator, rspAB operon transcriptional repressor
MAATDGQSSSMVNEVYSTLLTAILEARLGAGTPLSQNKLATHLGVSRTPVREALLRLEIDGLVRRTTDAGFVVASITPEEVNEACDLLGALDTFVYLRAAKTLGPDELEELLEIAEQLVRSAEAHDTDAWRQADRRFHEVVVEAAGERVAAQHVQQVRRRVQRFWVESPDFDGRLRTCSQDHVALIEAMIAHDEVTLAETINAHIERLRNNVLDRLRSAAPLLPENDPLQAVTPLA